MAITKASSSFSFWKGLSFFMIIKKLIVIIAVISFAFSGIQVFNETGSYTLAFEEIGGKMFNPLHNLGEHSIEVSEEGLIPSSGNIFNDFIEFLKNIWFFMDPFFGLLFSYFLILTFVVKPFLRHTNSPFVIHFFTALIFILINMLYIALFTDLSITRPFTAVGDFFNYIKGSFI